MKRRSLLRSVGLASALAAGTVTASVQPSGNRQWRLLSLAGSDSGLPSGAPNAFAQRVAAMTGGKFRITEAEPPDRTTTAEALNALRDGGIDVVLAASSEWAAADPTFALGCSIPFGLNARQLTAWTYRGNGLELLRAFYRTHGLINFPVGGIGTKMGAWYRRELSSVRDLPGMKMSVSGLAADVIARIGMVPVQVNRSDLPQAFEQGKVDAAESHHPSQDLRLGIQHHAPYHHYPGWWEGGRQFNLLVSARSFEALSLEHRSVLEAAATAAHTDIQAAFDGDSPAALHELVGAGVKLRRVPWDVMHAAFNAATELYADLSNSNPHWRRIYADYAAFAREQSMWQRFAETTYDDYIQSRGM